MLVDDLTTSHKHKQVIVMTTIAPPQSSDGDSSASSGSPPPVDNRSWVERHTPLTIALFSMLTAVVAAVGTVFSSPLWQGDGTTKSESASVRPKPVGTITEPSNPAVGSETSFSGTARNVPDGYTVWAFTKDVVGGSVYPKWSRCSLTGDHWDCGRMIPMKKSKKAGSPDRQSELQVWLVDADGVDEIMQYVIDTEYKNPKQQSTFRIPESSVYLDGFRVTSDE